MREKSLSVIFRETREFLGLSQAEFAEKLGIKSRMYGEYERGAYNDTKGDSRRVKLVKRAEFLRRQHEEEIKMLDQHGYAQQGDIGKRITELEAQVQDLQKLMNKLLIKAGLS